MPSTQPKFWFVPRLLLPLAVLLAAPAIPAVQAGYQAATFTFDYSNVFGSGNYGTVLLEAYTGAGNSNGLVNGQVRFTVTADFDSIYGDPAAAANFGIQKFGFNTNLTVPSTDIVVTDSGATNLLWKVMYDQNVSHFGVFSVEAQGTGKTRANPVIVTISNLGSNATLDHFVFLSEPHNGSFSACFVAHVAGFNEGPNAGGDGEPSSHYMAATEDCDWQSVPAPPGIVLALFGVIGIGLHGWRRRRAAPAA